jgi:hypothetical protein
MNHCGRGDVACLSCQDKRSLTAFAIGASITPSSDSGEASPPEAVASTMSSQVACGHVVYVNLVQPNNISFDPHVLR